MKIKIIVLAILFCQLQDTVPPANPAYNSPSALLAGIGPSRIYKSLCMGALAVSGYYKESKAYEDSLMGHEAPLVLSFLHKNRVDARPVILEEAKKYRFLLINESHIRPQHRLFTKSLLKDLYKEGYRVFMAEGIEPKNTISEKGYPTSGDGILINEPAYASLIRYALKIGFTVRAYEYASKKEYWDDSIKLDTFGSIKYISYEPRDSVIIEYDKHGLKNTTFTSVRERGQAANIVKVMREFPGAKFVIHVGHGHLHESGSMMGAKLKELLNYEDLLTVDQVEQSDRRAVVDSATGDTLRSARAYLLWDSGEKQYFNSLQSHGAQVDYQVFNAAVGDSLGRPDFLFKDPEPRAAYYVQKSDRQDCPCVFSAYYSKEYTREGAQAIAIDNIYLKDAASNPPLLLYSGRYVIVKRNRDGKVTRIEAGMP